MNRGHERFKEQLPAYSIGSLDPADSADLEHHLEGCAECRAELAWLAPASDVLARDVEQVEPSPEMRQRVMAAIDADLAGESAPASGPAADLADSPPAREVSTQPSRRRSDQGSWLARVFRPAVIGVAASALIVGVVIGVLLGGGGDSPSAPDQQVLTGQSTIGADAVMVASNGTGTLKLTNLKNPGEGQVYQAWIQRGQSVESTGSLFVPGEDGAATASIPDLTGASAVLVSTEPSGGSPQPTTAPVITVPLSG